MSKNKIGDIEVGQFAKKHVKRLNSKNKIWEAIELMNDFNIRHIPIEDGSSVKGILNPKCMMETLEHSTDFSVFDQSVGELVCSDYVLANIDEPLFNIIKNISTDNGLAAIIQNGGFIEGIYTEIDILNTDFLWGNINDRLIEVDGELGNEITEFNCVPSSSTIELALEIMLRLKTDYVGIIDERSKILSGVITFLDIVNFIYSINEKLEYLIETEISTIFPSSGLYISAPIMLSSLRREMYLNDTTVVVLLDEDSYPKRLIDLFDIIQYLIENSPYFPIID